MEYSPMMEDDPIKVFKKIYGDEAYKKAGTFPGALKQVKVLIITNLFLEVRWVKIF